MTIGTGLFAIAVSYVVTTILGIAHSVLMSGKHTEIDNLKKRIDALERII